MGKLCSQFVVAFDFRLMITVTFSRNLYSVSIWFDRCVDRPVAVVFMKQWCCSICWESRKRRDFMCVLSAWHYIKSSIISRRLMIVFGFHSLLPYSYCDTNKLTLSPISFTFPAPLFFLPAWKGSICHWKRGASHIAFSYWPYKMLGATAETPVYFSFSFGLTIWNHTSLNPNIKCQQFK